MSPAAIFHAPNERPLRRVGPDFVRYIVRSGETGGSYFAFEVHTKPGGGPPLHRHDYHESFLVLGGEITFQIDRDGTLATVTAAAGSSLYVPPGCPHTFHNNSHDYTHMVVVHAPAALEGFFETVGVEVKHLGEGEELVFDPAEIGAALAREGVHIIGANSHV
jgi:quercetin dioxygenase-like cupin family protein